MNVHTKKTGQILGLDLLCAVRFEVFNATKIHIGIWVVTPCSVCGRIPMFTLKMEAAEFPETLASYSNIILHYNSEDLELIPP